MDYSQIHQFLTGTIAGILILGAAGSILGTALIWLSIRIVKWYVKEVALDHAIRVVFPYARSIKRAEDLKAYLSQPEKREQYRLCLYESMISTNLSIAIFFVLFIVANLSFLIFWPEKPYPVAFIIAATLYSFHSLLQAGLEYYVLQPDELRDVKKDIRSRYRTFKEFDRAIAEEAKKEAEEAAAREANGRAE